MSTKPFLAVNIIDGDLGRIYERSTFEEAVEVAVQMVKEQCGVDEAEIREELTNDGNFVPEGGGFKTYIAQPEDD